MLKFDEFQSFMTTKMECIFQGAKVAINEVKKNNNITLTAITVLPAGKSISPNVYLDHFYEEYENGKNLDAIVKEIVKIVENNLDAPAEFDGVAEKFMSWESIKDKVIFSLVNGEKNKEFLKTAPHIMVEDLAVIFKVLLVCQGDSTGTIKILNDHLKFWGVTAEDLMDAAKANTEKLLPVAVQTMEEVLMEMMADDGMPEDFLSIFHQERPLTETMFVISNKSRVNGAGSILCKDVLADLSAKIGTDLYILPSSIHEVIVVSEKMGTPEVLKEMVQEVNGTQVLPEEQLSDNVYKYCRETKTFSVA